VGRIIGCRIPAFAGMDVGERTRSIPPIRIGVRMTMREWISDWIPASDGMEGGNDSWVVDSRLRGNDNRI
jgi:hypothetical protein